MPNRLLAICEENVTNNVHILNKTFENFPQILVKFSENFISSLAFKNLRSRFSVQMLPKTVKRFIVIDDYGKDGGPRVV